MNNYNLKNNKGFSLVESVIYIGILALIVGAIGAFQLNVFNLNGIISTSLKNQNELSKILNPAANEIRSAGISDEGGYPIEQASSTSLTFFTDLNGDGSLERVRYFKDGTDFKKGITESSGNPATYDLNDENIIQVVHDVVDLGTPVFQYYDATYDGSASSSPLSDPVTVSEITLIEINVSSDADVNKPPAASTVSTLVTVRNLQDDI